MSNSSRSLQKPWGNTAGKTLFDYEWDNPGMSSQTQGAIGKRCIVKTPQASEELQNKNTFQHCNAHNSLDVTKIPEKGFAGLHIISVQHTKLTSSFCDLSTALALTRQPTVTDDQ